MREVSMLEPSEEGKGERSRTAMAVWAYWGRRVRDRALDKPKTPDPTIRIEDGGTNVMFWKINQ
jgi:hypothetical protein